MDKQRVDPLGTVTCPTCTTIWCIGVILHRSTPKTRKMKTPHDWVMPASTEVPA